MPGLATAQTIGKPIHPSISTNMPEDEKEDSNIAYFKGLANKSAPLRGEKPAPKVDSTKSLNKVESDSGVLKYDDDDLKYMSKQASKIGERLTKTAQKRYTKQMPKR